MSSTRSKRSRAIPPKVRKSRSSRNAPAQTTAHAAFRTALAQRAPDAWLDRDEAAVYLGVSRKTIRNLMHAGSLVADGRGARRVPLFYRRTLDVFLASRAEVSS
jgi:excisionase family DNA binding protein